MFKKLVIFSAVFISVTVLALQGQYKVLHEFTGTETDGIAPRGSLIAKGNMLYGMSERGGTFNGGTIFKISVEGTGFALLHSFSGASDGWYPSGSLTLYNGKLYGMTALGGAIDVGVIFRINTDGTGFTVLHSFVGGTTDGAFPFGSLILYNGQFYGTTWGGGSKGRGTVFRISPSMGGFKIVHSFGGGAMDGQYPAGTLTLVGTRFFGTTAGGGASDNGTIFRILPGGAGFKVLHSFTGGTLDGSGPFYGPLAVSGPWLFGMTRQGGANDDCGIFKIKTDGSEYEFLYSLGSSDGINPWGSVTYSGSKLYGMTIFGGSDGYGTIFVINADGTDFEVLHSFGFDPIGQPQGDLLRVVTNKYGTMLYGMTAGCIFSYKLR